MNGKSRDEKELEGNANKEWIQIHGAKRIRVTVSTGRVARDHWSTEGFIEEEVLKSRRHNNITIR